MEKPAFSVCYLVDGYAPGRGRGLHGIQRAAAPVRRMPSTPVARIDRLPPVICAFRNTAIFRALKSAMPESAAGISMSPRK